MPSPFSEFSVPHRRHDDRKFFNIFQQRRLVFTIRTSKVYLSSSSNSVGINRGRFRATGRTTAFPFTSVPRKSKSIVNNRLRVVYIHEPNHSTSFARMARVRVLWNAKRCYWLEVLQRYFCWLLPLLVHRFVFSDFDRKFQNISRVLVLILVSFFFLRVLLRRNSKCWLKSSNFLTRNASDISYLSPLIFSRRNF